MSKYKAINKKILYLLLVILMVLLILDIQDGSLDTAVLVSHNLEYMLSYANNLKLSSNVCDLFFTKALLNILCLYLFNFNFALLFDVAIQLLNKWNILLDFLSLLTKFQQYIFAKRTFIEYHANTSNAYISLP